MPNNPFVETRFNPKGVLFYGALTGVAVNLSIAYGPARGALAFGFLALIILVFG